MIKIGQISAQLSEIGPLRSKLEHYLAKSDLDESTRSNVLLSCSEWLTNLIRHNQPKTISVGLEKRPAGLNVLIEDDGPAFTDLQNYFDTATLPDDMEAEGGRGLFIIKQLFPDFKYQAGNPNQFSISIPLTQKPTLAIVEDDKALCKIFKAYLNEDYSVSVYNGAEDFLKSNQHFDLIVSDISMPGLSGLELKEKLSQHQHLTPFIFLTSHEDETTEVKATELGIDDYLHKPVTKQQLLSVVKRVLTRQKQLGDILDHKVTESLHPQLPEKISHYQICTFSQAASAGGGDFIVHLHNEKQDLIFLGDVMGHGLDAKFFAHVYAGYIQGLIKALPIDSKPNILLEKLSSMIYEDKYLESIILTCLVCAIDKNGKVKLASAGHPQPLLIDKEAGFLDVQGSLPGIEKTSRYELKEFDIKHKKLLLYTDGLFEMGDTESEREENKSDVINNLKNNHSINSYLKAFITKHKPQDDVTFILIGDNE